MNIRYYYNFIVIVEEGSLTAAARKQHIAQPALSNQIKALEDDYGARLFYRGSRKLELTDAGYILYEKAKLICAIEVAAQNEIRSGYKGSHGHLKVGITSSGCNFTFYRALVKFETEHPDVGLRVIDDHPEELLKLLQNGEIEAAIARFYDEIPENFEVLFTEKDVNIVAYSADMKLFPRTKSNSISINDLSGVPLSLIERLVPTIENAFKRNNLMCNIRCVSTRMHLAMMWAREGRAACIVPKRAVRDLGFTDLLYKELRPCEIEMPVRQVIVQKGRYRAQLVNEFIKTMSEVYSFDIDEEILTNRKESIYPHD